MEGSDPDTMQAYYMFVNHGRFPSEYEKLPYRERILVREFVKKELASRKKLEKGG